MIITKQDTNGTKPLLSLGEFGYDNYPTGGDDGRVYVGTGTENIPLARLDELIDGDMTKLVYDTNSNGIVDNAETVNGLTVETAVPSGALFTDTILTEEQVKTKYENNPNTNPFTDTLKILLETKKVKNVETDAINNKLVITYTDDTTVALNLNDIVTDVNVTSASLDATTNVLTLVGDEGGANVIVDLSDFVNSSELTTALNTKANNSTTLAGYGITDTYTKAEIGTLADNYVSKGTFANNQVLRGDGTDTAQGSEAYIDDDGEIRTTVNGIEHKLSEKSDISDLNGAIGNISSPLLDLPLQNSLNMKAGAGAVTFTRSTTATYIDRYGVMQYASIDEPRFEADGLLIEGASTNNFIHSTLSTGWSASRGTLTSSSLVSPDGISMAMYLDENTTAGATYIYQSVTLTDGIVYTNSIFVKDAGEQSGVKLSDVNNAIYTYTFSTDTATEGMTVTKMSDGWVRLSVTATRVSTFTGNFISFSLLDDIATTGNGVYIWGAQLEELPFTTSYIPTTTTAVTRNADVCYVNFSNNCPEFVNSDFSFHVEFDTTPTYYSQPRQIVAMSYVTTPLFNMLRVEKNDLTPNISYYRSGGGHVIDDVAEYKTYKITVSVEASTDTIYSYSDGALTGTSVNPINNGEYSSNKMIGLGNRDTTVSSYPLFGHIKNFKIFDKALSEFEASLL